MSIMGNLTDLLGINRNAGDAQLQQALEALQAVGVPTEEQLKLPELQKYVAAGVLTPEQYQAIMADPNAYTQAIQENQDNSGLNAQKAALEQLSSIVDKGGSTEINDANLANNINQTNQAMQAARGGIEDDAKQRGVYGGGLEFINKLLNEQGNAQNANLGAVNAGANNAKLALDALTQSGQLGTSMQGQANQSAQAQAQAAQQIAEYNAQLQNTANQYNTQTANAAQAANLSNAQDIGNMNTQNANYRTQYNAQIPQQIFNNNMAKAGAESTAYNNLGELSQQHAANDSAFLGNLIGTGANMYGDAQKGKPKGYAQGGEVKAQCYAQGGEVHDHRLCMAVGGEVPGEASIPGDHAGNDDVPAWLSPEEIVLPNSVTQAPNAPEQAAKFVGNIKGASDGMTPNVNSFAEILAKLEENGLELRLTSKGM